MDRAMFSNFAAKTGSFANPSRRNILQMTVGAGAGLLLGLRLPVSHMGDGAAAQTGSIRFTPFIEIRPDGKVVVFSKHLDKGQGTATGLATLVAEELDADWSQIVPAFAPADASLYQNLFFGVQGTGGSTAMANSWDQYRKAGASARRMLILAASKAWQVPSEQITIQRGIVRAGSRSSGFGELASAAAAVPVPDNPPLKRAQDYVYIGKKFPRLDSKDKSRGAPLFTQDLKLPDMLVAVVAHPPRFGAKVKTFDAAKAKTVRGVVDVVSIGSGVAVLATSTWPAIKGRDALTVEWDDSAAEKRGTTEILTEYRRLADTPGAAFRSEGEAESALAKAAKVVEAEYVFPFLAHAAMEPMNAAVQFSNGRVKVWTGSQLQTVDQAVLAGLFGVKPADVSIETMWAGGSFGRRAVPNSDYIHECGAVAKAYGKPVPIKLVWTREDDTRGGYYRPMVLHRVRAGIDAAGRIVGWQHRIVGQSILIGTPFEAAMVKNGIDATLIEGVVDMPYAVGAMQADVHQPKIGIPALWWRSVGHTHTAYVVETMIDALADAAGQDPVAYRLSLLDKHPRHQAVLKLAAEKAGWGGALPDGVKRGVALHESFQSVVAQVVEVRAVAGRPKVLRVVAAVDCGVAINPDNIAAQVEGGIGFGLGAALASKITLTGGVVDQGNFDGYEVLRIDEMPAVDVHILPSSAAPTGIGEPGTPPIAPAVANAYAALTGKRVRTLPFSDGLSI